MKAFNFVKCKGKSKKSIACRLAKRLKDISGASKSLSEESKFV